VAIRLKCLILQKKRSTKLAERNAKTALAERQGEFLDKSLLTLAAGALGLTLTFLHEHGTGTAALPWVYFGMSLFVLCLLFVLLSLIFSQRSIIDRIDALDGWCGANFCSWQFERKEGEKQFLGHGH